MKERMILYRGNLRSCNYHCSYCPFSKRPMSERELEKDRVQWYGFVESLEVRAGDLGIGALMVVPYGEALIHSWYWKGLARISRLEGMDGVGAQTNLSFPIEKCIREYVEWGGNPGKLRLWATFHPEMISVPVFAQHCRQLWEMGISLCAGSVGVPENQELLRQLRAELPEEIYLWVNKMDGLKRSYTQEEIETFLQIDPFFLRELLPHPAEASMCVNRLFVEGDGRLHTCNISQLLDIVWEDVCGKMEGTLDDSGKGSLPGPRCSHRYCSCFLAYGGRTDFINRILFGNYPLFRIPRRPKAVFLDIEGTLISESGISGKKYALGQSEISQDILAGLEALAKAGVRLFFATTLPFGDAMKRCSKIRHLFCGGIYAGGAHLRLISEGETREKFYELDHRLPADLELLKEKGKFRILIYRQGERVYKITLLRPLGRPWSEEEGEELCQSLPDRSTQVRYFIEGNCLQILSADADKARGVKTLCGWMGISTRDIAAAGNSREDEEMLRLCES